MAKIVIIEDEENLRYSVRKRLSGLGHSVFETAAVAEALSLIQAQEPEVVLTDINLADGGNGLDLVRRLRAEGFGGAILVLTAYGTVESAVQAMKDGADEYLQKPISLDELQVLVDRALEYRRVRTRLALYERIEKTRDREQEVLGRSKSWRATVELAERFAGLPLDSAANALDTILLLGETGTGKGVLARHIHHFSAQREAPFVHVNCSALPASLIESELFGHEKGAFTDAREARQGFFELADGGTIFLDEIGDLPINLQSKLLIIVEQGTLRRIGGTKERKVKVRIIAATNHDLPAAVEKGEFRRDLFYRLNALTIPIPPLRDRDDDAILIAESLLPVAAKKLHRPGLKLTDAACDAIRAHSWPGNVRELANTIQRAALLAAGTEIQPADLAVAPPGKPGAADFGGVAGRAAALRPASTPEELSFDFRSGTFAADEVEKHLIIAALRHCRGNVSKSAKLIDMNRSSLRYRIERYHLDQLVQEIAER